MKNFLSWLLRITTKRRIHKSQNWVGCEEWQGVAAALSYMLVWGTDSPVDIDLVARKIKEGNSIVFSAREISTALELALASQEDLSKLLPDNYPDCVLRSMFRQLLPRLA